MAMSRHSDLRPFALTWVADGVHSSRAMERTIWLRECFIVHGINISNSDIHLLIRVMSTMNERSLTGPTMRDLRVKWAKVRMTAKLGPSVLNQR